jgi:hypothetical protein
LRTLAWAVTGLVLEQDARIARQTVAFDAPEAMDARVRRMERLLDSMLDPHRLYGSILQPHLTRWNGRTAWLALDTSSLRDCSRRVHHRLGLTPGHQWMPYRSFESKNAYWWSPDLGFRRGLAVALWDAARG